MKVWRDFREYVRKKWRRVCIKGFLHHLSISSRVLFKEKLRKQSMSEEVGEDEIKPNEISHI